MTDPMELADRLEGEPGDCPFCGHDPYHYVDNGVGMERVAVTCCDEGIALFQCGDPVLTEQISLRREAAACIREMVEWRHVESHPAYSVYRDGRVRRGDRILGQWLNGNGYAMVRLSGPRTTARVHQLVARAFLPPDDARPFVNHKNNDRADNRVENLEWCTQAENISHAERQGRMQRDYWTGRRSPSAKLTDEAAAMIRAEAADGRSYSEIAERFGTNKRTVGRIVNNQTYLPPAPGHHP